MLFEVIGWWVKLECPYVELCAVPQVQSKKNESYIMEVCKTDAHRLCMDKLCFDDHFSPMSQEERAAEWQRIKEYYQELKIGDK